MRRLIRVWRTDPAIGGQGWRMLTFSAADTLAEIEAWCAANVPGFLRIEDLGMVDA